MTKKRVTFGSALYGSAENQVRKLLGLPPVSTQRHTLTSWAKTGIQRRVISVLGLERGETIVSEWPADVFECLDRYVQVKGGNMKVGDGLNVPLLKLNRKSAVSLSSMWIAYIDFEHESANFKGLQASEEILEDAISRECGTALNLRILSKPARIEIDKPTPPIFTLKSKWESYINGTEKAERYLLGIESTIGGDVRLNNRLSDSNEYSCAFLGASGSGKTQAITSALLTLCACTSPEDLAVIVVDPKGLDLPLDGLPHLAMETITDRNLAANVVLALAVEMERRATARERDASRKHILLVIDELGFLVQGKRGTEITEALVKIGEMGRAWGIHMFLGSQRAVNEFFPISVLSQIPAKWIGRVRDGVEASFAGGKGCDAHKLPGKGAAMLYEPDATARIQSTYIGDAKQDDYPEVVGWFIKTIAQRWAGKQPHWRFGASASSTSSLTGATRTASVAPVSEPAELAGMVEEAMRRVLTEMATISQVVEDTETEADAEAPDTSIIDELPEELLSALESAYNEQPERFNKQRVRDIHQRVIGKSINSERANQIYTPFLAWVGT